MDNSVKSNTDFWIEINKNNIHVPYYQRDYAQGRCDGGRIDNIRKVFVEELYQAITAPNGEKICHLGLVFGSYDVNNNLFVAVDGQQRLTTVFLLHWYVAWHEGKLSDYEKTLKNFSWDTRSYSSQFVALLFSIKLSNNVIEAIKTNCNYFSIWENDPTVKGMLIMLKEIEKQYPKTKVGLCSKLFSNDCNIRYDILRLEKNSDRKTYLKMNSRGRSLTTFELFKSKFIDNYYPSFASKFDNTWLDFMLSMSKNENGDFADPDISYMNFINEYTYMILSLCSNDDSDKGYKLFINAKMKNNLTDVPFISFEKYKTAFQNINSFEKFFDWICANYETIKCLDEELRFPDSKFFVDEIIKSPNPHFSHRTKLFSLYRYAELTKYANIDKELHERWNRVFRNLVANSEINGNNFGKICKNINQISNADIYWYLANGENLDTFDKGQIEEEIAKAKQILDENGCIRKYEGKSKKEDETSYETWKDIIIDAEKYAFFKGAIRFLFQDGNGEVDVDPIAGTWNTNHFDAKWGNAKKYFDKDGKGVSDKYKQNALLLRSLLSHINISEEWFGNYASYWREKLLDEDESVIHDLLIKEPTISQKCDQEWIKDTHLLSFLLKNKESWHIFTDWRGHNVITHYSYRVGKVNSWDEVVVTDHIRNELLFTHDIELQKDRKIGNTNYLFGWDINFKYKNQSFQWYGNPHANKNTDELDVYLIKDINNYNSYIYKDSSKTKDIERFYCFEVSDKMGDEEFKVKLDNLILEATRDGKLSSASAQ